MYKYFFKRLIDFIIVFCVLVVIWPILLIITLWLHFANKGAGAFFAQERPGKGGKVFKVIKFKTMTDERDADGNLLPDADRLTNVGRFVRSTSIDELPQLINVLKGDMALIGPRPLLVQYLPLYSKEQARRHDVRPGITGWAQVNGRNAISWTKKFELDVWYVDHCSFWLDTLIKAFQYLPTEQYELWLVGDGERRSTLEDLVSRLGILENVRFWGIRSDIPVLLKSSDIIVMSSHFEGLSLSSIEGMAVDRPFIASDVDGLHEITKNAGILFPHGDAKALANIILRLKEEPYYRQIADRCQQRASKYDIRKTVTAYLEIYKQLV